MIIKKFSDSKIFKNGESCEVREYEFNDPDINIGTAVLSGRFPESGYLVNEKVKEYAYVIDGKGSISTKTKTFSFTKGDVIMIPVDEAYFWDAYCSLVMPCAPAWYPEQSKRVE